MNLACSILALLLAGSALAQPSATPAASAPASQAAPRAESCPAEPAAVFALASRRGYLSSFTVLAGEAACSIDDQAMILVVSATATANGKCQFDLWAPPLTRRLGVLRIGTKEPGAAVRFHQRADASKGVRFALEAPRGQTRQFRVTDVDVEPDRDACPATVLDGAMK